MLACRVAGAGGADGPGRRALLCQAPARPHPLGDASRLAPLGRSGQPAAVHALPPGLAARRARAPPARLRRRRSRSSSSCRATRRPSTPGSRRSCPPGSPATTPPSSTSGAPGARSPSAGSRPGPRTARAARPGAAARLPRRRPRSAFFGATTSTGSSPSPGATAPGPAHASGPPWRWSRPSGRHGALFVTDLCQLTGRMPGEVAEALWDGMARGLLTADGFQAVRALLSGRGPALGRGSFPARAVAGAGCRRPGRGPGLPRPGRSRSRVRPAVSGGRWSLLGDGRLRAISRATRRAGQARTPTSWPRRSRASCSRAGASCSATSLCASRSRSPGGTFSGPCGGWRRAASFSEARMWRASRASSSPSPRPPSSCGLSPGAPRDGVVVQLSATDPLNLTGVILPGPRVPAQHARTITLERRRRRAARAGDPPRARRPRAVAGLLAG